MIGLNRNVHCLKTVCVQGHAATDYANFRRSMTKSEFQSSQNFEKRDLNYVEIDLLRTEGRVAAAASIGDRAGGVH